MNGIGFADDFIHFRRLRPQARFGAQPPKAALGAEINTIILHSAFYILHSGDTPVYNNLPYETLTLLRMELMAPFSSRDTCA